MRIIRGHVGISFYFGSPPSCNNLIYNLFFVAFVCFHLNLPQSEARKLLQRAELGGDEEEDDDALPGTCAKILHSCAEGRTEFQERWPAPVSQQQLFSLLKLIILNRPTCT